MFEDYKMLRSSGISPVGAALMSAYLIMVAGPLLMMADWYGRNYVGECIDDFPEYPGSLELAENQGIFHDNLVDCPPVGSPEWDDWVESQKGLE